MISRDILPNSLAARGLSLPPRRDHVPTPTVARMPAGAAKTHDPVRRKGGQRMYGTAQVDRTNSDWPITLTSQNAEILVSAIATRSRLRQLERDDDYFRNMLNIVENGVVGCYGIRLTCTFPEDKRQALLRGWYDYQSPKNCNVNRWMHGVAVQRLAIRSLCRDGGMIFRCYPGFDNDHGFAIQDREIDFLDHYWSRPGVWNGQNQIQFSIEMDQYGASVAYHILHRHPGEVFAYMTGPRYRDRVPSSQVIAFLNRHERSNSFTGMPLWPSVGVRLNHLRNYNINELIASRIEASKGGWFKREGMESEYAGQEDEDGNQLRDTQPGQWEVLPKGWDPVANDPKHPVDAYADFCKGQLRGASAGALLPYNSVANDLEGVNYSSIRSGTLEARDTFKYLQYRLSEEFMQPLFEHWIPFAILRKRIPFEMSDIPDILAACSWMGRRWDWVDPRNDAQAAQIALACRLTSHRREIQQREEDGDIDDVFAEQAADKKLAAHYGIDLDTESAANDKPSNVDKPDNS